jgi:hypothetical protein
VKVTTVGSGDCGCWEVVVVVGEVGDRVVKGMKNAIISVSLSR